MDSRKKPQPGVEKRPGRSEPQTSARRPQSAGRGEPRQHPEQRRQNPVQRGKQRPDPRRTQDRSRPDPRQEIIRRERQEAARGAENAVRRHQTAARNTDDVVFKMDNGELGKKRPPRDPAEVKRLQQRRRSARRAQEREQQAKRRSRAPKVVYTQPRPFDARRLLLQLGIVTAVVLAVMLGLSVFFKVDKVVVYGNKAYSAWTVQEASGIESGERLLSINNARASGKIKMALPYVDQVRIGINLPDTVNIYITEYDVVYSVQSQNDTWWLMTSDGRVVEQTDGGTAGNYTKVLGVKLDTPVPGEDAKAYEQPINQSTATDAAQDTSAETETPTTVVTAASQLSAALTILDALEVNDLVGTAASVDVTNISDIELWYGTQYKIRLGDVSQMDYKITCVRQSVAQLGEYETGILDVSFTTWADGPFYTPFE